MLPRRSSLTSLGRQRAVDPRNGFTRTADEAMATRVTVNVGRAEHLFLANQLMRDAAPSARDVYYRASCRY